MLQDTNSLEVCGVQVTSCKDTSYKLQGTGCRDPENLVPET